LFLEDEGTSGASHPTQHGIPKYLNSQPDFTTFQ